MANTMTPQEAQLREEIGRAVTTMRSTIRHMPYLDTVDRDGLGEIGIKIHDVYTTAARAELLTFELEQLEGLTEDATALAVSARLAIEMLRSLLSVIAAEFDIRAA